MATTKVKKKSKEIALILCLSLVACGIIGYFDGFAPIPYLYKACGKICLFVGTPLLYWKLCPHFSYRPLFRLEKEPLFLAGMLGCAVLFLILGTYFLLGAFLDLSAVTGELEERMNINKSNFIAVAVYIAVCNSFLEEFFFRGFLFFRLKALSTGMFAHLASSIIFSLYHVAIMVTWFDWWVFAVCILALVVGGVIFNFLDEKTESLYPSWLTHGCANIAINSIGMFLFYG
ncbi:MAG: CPBP family intramembrane glutamic endopeptidase [Eubacteriales bacterium]